MIQRLWRNRWFQEIKWCILFRRDENRPNPPNEIRHYRILFYFWKLIKPRHIVIRISESARIIEILAWSRFTSDFFFRNKIVSKFKVQFISALKKITIVVTTNSHCKSVIISGTVFYSSDYHNHVVKSIIIILNYFFLVDIAIKNSCSLGEI